MGKHYVDYQGKYFEREADAVHWYTGEKLVMLQSLDDADGKFYAYPEAHFNEEEVDRDGVWGPRFRELGAGDKVSVLHYTLMCPGCCETLPRGKFKTKDAAKAALAAKPYCDVCHGVEEVEDPGDWLYEHDFQVQPVYAASWLADLQTSTNPEDYQE